MILQKAFVKMKIFGKKLIITNKEPQKNKEVYDEVIKELNEQYESIFSFSVKQVWIKFKNCVSQYKRINLLQKSASGVRQLLKIKELDSGSYSLTSSLALKICANLSRQQSPHIRHQHQKRKKAKKKEKQKKKLLQLAEKQKKEIRQNFSQSNNPVSQTRFEPLQKIKTKGRNSDLKSAVNAFNKLVNSNPTK